MIIPSFSARYGAPISDAIPDEDYFAAALNFRDLRNAR